MNTIVELHDSIVAGITENDRTVIVRFAPAYLHKSEGRPGIDSGSGWVQAARLTLGNSAVSGVIPDLPCRIMDGDLVICGERHNNEIPVPLETTGPVELKLEFDPVQNITVTGRGARLELLGEPKYVAEFPR